VGTEGQNNILRVRSHDGFMKSMRKRSSISAYFGWRVLLATAEQIRETGGHLLIEYEGRL